MSVLGIIPARGGSKRIPRKNIKKLAGRPLIAWTIETALRAKGIDRLVVSTEDEEIAEVAKQFGAEVPFIRPLSLAEDRIAGIEAVLHAIQTLPDFDWVLLLQPTSPLRSVSDIEGIIRFCEKEKAYSAVSITRAVDNPFLMYRRNVQNNIQPLLSEHYEADKRLQFPEIYKLNGALYLARTSWLVHQRSFIGLDTLGFLMPPERSVDIDSQSDWEWCEYLIAKHNAF